MISVEGISKSYGGQVLFRDLSWRIADRERIGLVGPNGAGKTTICRILAGVEEPDTGRVSRGRSVTVGYLPQEVAGSSAGSVLTEALAGFEEVWALEREMETVAHALETTPSETLTARYGELQHRFEALGGYCLESRAKAILSGLGFRPGVRHRRSCPLLALTAAPGWCAGRVSYGPEPDKNGQRKYRQRGGEVHAIPIGPRVRRVGFSKPDSGDQH